MANGARYPSGYYQNAFQAAGESEGSGSSGQVDTEMTASEDSSAPPRKLVSLNSDVSNAYGVPTQVLSVSNITQSERKELVSRLKSELAQIRVLQKRVELQRRNGVVVSSSSDILSCSNVQNGPQVESFGKVSAFNSRQRKEVDSTTLKASGQKMGNYERYEAAKEAPVTSTGNAMLMKQCETLLQRLMNHQHAPVFNTPVDVVKFNIPDYFTIIKHPMDLGTVKSKLVSGAYQSPLEFATDVRLTFSNAMAYNPKGNYVHNMADTLKKYFEVRWKNIEKKLPVGAPQLLPVAPEPVPVESAKSTPPLKRRKVNSVQNDPQPLKREMTGEEKRKLGLDLESIIGEMPDHIIEFLKEQFSKGTDSAEEEIEIDVDELSNEAMFTLRKLLDDYLREKQNNQGKGEPCEIEMLNESGLSNSSTQHCKGNDPADEDIDIGGNEPPVSSCTPLEIEKDAGRPNTKYSSSGDSSDSDSSSSDGDSEGDDKASSPVTVAKAEDIVSSEAHLDTKIHGGDSVEANQCVSDLDQVEQTNNQKPSSAESNCQDGNNAHSEKQVSPGRHYRAALLKNRFAETILKAREKTLVQGGKVDPEKLRREREELELQRKKEKERLQAEARAAEDARRRAETEAAEDAKRKRDLEREAARQALLKMEKTVEINENSRFLKDLEMLRSGPVDQLPSSVDETSPDHSQEGLGGFKFGGGNPLEQLGLYMKEDEEEEDGDLPNAPKPVNDVEEGEID